MKLGSGLEPENLFITKEFLSGIIIESVLNENLVILARGVIEF